MGKKRKENQTNAIRNIKLHLLSYGIFFFLQVSNTQNPLSCALGRYWILHTFSCWYLYIFFIYWQSINVMDYSLLVGVDAQRRELVCDIIDYLRQYTWDKQLETWVKSSLVVPRNQLPTIISPREYKKRFRKFITTYFLSVPDHWCSQRSSNPCKLCGTGEDDSSPTRSQENGVPNCFSR